MLNHRACYQVQPLLFMFHVTIHVTFEMSFLSVKNTSRFFTLSMIQVKTIAISFTLVTKYRNINLNLLLFINFFVELQFNLCKIIKKKKIIQKLQFFLLKLLSKVSKGNQVCFTNIVFIDNMRIVFGRSINKLFFFYWPTTSIIP